MKAHVGDRIILAPPTVSAPLHDGEVLEARGPDGPPPFLVRWSDGHVGLFFPGHGSVLHIGPQEASASVREQNAPVPVEAGPPASSSTAPLTAATPQPATTHEWRRVRDWQVRITIFESDEDTDAKVVLLADSQRHLTAAGHSHRSPGDPTVPEIGDEVAVARALRRLADELLATAAGDIEQFTGEHDVTLEAT